MPEPNPIAIIERHLKPYIERFKDIDPRYFNTAMSDFRFAIEKDLANVSGETLLQFIHDLFAHFTGILDYQSFYSKATADADKELEELYTQEPATKLLYELICEADQKINYVSFAFFIKSGLFQYGAKGLRALEYINEYQEYTGEHRATIAVRLFREVSETVYDQYARFVWNLTTVIKGEPISNMPEKFGVLIDGLSNRLKKINKEGLIQSNAGWLRNATTHHHWNYNIEDDSITLWDNKRPRQKTTVELLYKNAYHMYMISYTNMIKLNGIYNRKNFFLDSGLCEFLFSNWKALFGGEEEINTKYDLMLKRIFKDCTNFF